MAVGTATLLASKLRAPRERGDAVPRPRLVERFRQSLAAPLILVAAPAGSGKTTLLVQALRQLDLPFGWLNVDEADNEPVRFAHYLLAAAERVLPGLSEADLHDVALEALVEEILLAADELPGPAAIVLDDFHVLEQAAIHSAVQTLVEAGPRHLRLVLATREDPPMPLARLRARGQLAEIRLVDLRFASGEADHFLQTSMGLDLSADERATLLERTEGWAAGLQLAALSLRGQGDAVGAIDRLNASRRFVLDYLTDEVLDRQPNDVQQFLLRTSILERLSGPLVDATLQSHASAGMLRRLERANLFLVSLDDEAEWYRYHALFADSLRIRARASLDDELSTLHRRAMAWFLDQAAADRDRLWYLNQALRHALAAGDVAQAIDLVARASAWLLGENEQVTLLRWLDELPRQIVGERADLAVSAAWAHGLIGQPTQRDAWVADAERALATAEKRGELATNHADLRGNVATLRAWSAHDRGDLDSAIAWYRTALVHFPERGSAGRVAAHLHLGMVLAAADRFDEAQAQFRQTVERGLGGTNRYAAVAALTHLGNLYLARGQFGNAEAEFRRAIDAGQGPAGRPLGAASAAYLGLGRLALQRDDLAAAEMHLVEAHHLSEHGAQWHVGVAGALELAWLRQLQGDPAAADTLLRDARRLAARYLDDTFGARVTEVEARIAAARTARPPVETQSVARANAEVVLSAREQEMLALLASGLSNQEIAERLVMTVGTVKWYLHHLYGKLAVRGRTCAIARGRELGLIQ
jgi:LuxR family maltose regulon positive regulatory protein